VRKADFLSVIVIGARYRSIYVCGIAGDARAERRLAYFEQSVLIQAEFDAEKRSLVVGF
jgi:hypothetical protein